MRFWMVAKVLRFIIGLLWNIPDKKKRNASANSLEFSCVCNLITLSLFSTFWRISEQQWSVFNVTMFNTFRCVTSVGLYACCTSPTHQTDNIPIQIHSLLDRDIIGSMRRWYSACIQANGGHTSYTSDICLYLWVKLWLLYIRPPDKSAYPENYFLITQPRHMLWVLKRTVSMRRFFWAPKTC